MKARIRRDPTLSLHAVYEEVVSELPDDASVKSSLYRCQAAQMPAIPANIDDVVIGVWSQTRDGRRFLRMLDRDWGIAVFASDYCIRQLGQCTQFFMDATFNSCPRPYTDIGRFSLSMLCTLTESFRWPSFSCTTEKWVHTGRYLHVSRTAIQGSQDVPCSLTSLSPTLKWLSALL